VTEGSAVSYKGEVDRFSPRLLTAAGVLVAGLVAVLLLQDHLVGDFTASLNVVPRSYRAWRDPVALLSAFAAIALALRVALRRRHRFELALGVVGCTLAAAVYVHQQDVHTFVCLPGEFCPAIMFRPDLWHDSRSLLIVGVGFAVAVVLMLPRGRIVTQRLHPRRG
jgi:hypothetical protein